MSRRHLLALCLLLSACSPRSITLTRSRLMMGHVPVNLSIHTTSNLKDKAIQAGESAYRLAQTLESQISEYQPDSEVSCLNRRAGIGDCPLSPGTLDLLRQSISISEATGHAFDIRFASKSPAGIRGPILLHDSPPSGRLSHPDTRIGIGAIGKGWIVDRMIEHLTAAGFKNVLIDAGGDLRASGGPWKIAIQIPEGAPGATTSLLEIRDRAFATSGLYEQGSHILDPKTRRPVERRGSVTVEGDNLTLADALATAYFVMGEEKSIIYLKRFPNMDMRWTDPDGQVRSYRYPADSSRPMIH